MVPKRTIARWIDELPKRGSYTFSLDDVVAEFPGFTRARIHLELSRQATKGKVQSVWRGFYAVVLHEFGLKGDVPPSEYIDQLMRYLGRSYYVALLSAASYHGSSHQSPQAYMVMVEGNTMRTSIKTGTRLSFFTKKSIPLQYTDNAVSRSGYITFSSKELTSLDLVAKMKDIGGPSRAAEVIDGLADEGLNFGKVEPDFFSLEPTAHIQRLGYILDEVLGYSDIADELFAKTIDAGLRFKHTMLVPTASRPNGDFSIHPKWRVAANKEVELER